MIPTIDYNVFEWRMVRDYLDYLAENKAYITRDGFGRFNLYREVEG